MTTNNTITERQFYRSLRQQEAELTEFVAEVQETSDALARTDPADLVDCAERRLLSVLQLTEYCLATRMRWAIDNDEIGILAVVDCRHSAVQNQIRDIEVAVAQAEAANKLRSIAETLRNFYTSKEVDFPDEAVSSMVLVRDNFLTRATSIDGKS